MKKRFSEEQMIAFLKEADSGVPVKELARKYGCSDVREAKGLSARRSLRVIGMSASALRYSPRPNRNDELRDPIVVLAQRYRRNGASMII